MGQPEEIRWPERSSELLNWLESERIKVDGKESKSWQEWWCICEFLTLTKTLAPFGPDFLIRKVPAPNPDFMVKTTTDRFGIEVTEATIPDDRRAIKFLRNSEDDQVHLIGEPVISRSGKAINGGRFQGGVVGMAYEEAMADDIRVAIDRKKDKNYGIKSDLLIYPNSNAIFAKPSVVAKLLQNNVPSSSFGTIWVLTPSHSVLSINGRTGDVSMPIPPESEQS